MKGSPPYQNTAVSVSFGIICPGCAPPSEESLPQKVTTNFAVSLLYVGFYFCPKAFIPQTSCNIWHYVEAKSLERERWSFSRSSSSPYEKNQWAPALLSKCVVGFFCVFFFCVCDFFFFWYVFCPVPFIWNHIAFLLYLKSSFLGKQRPCCL